MGQLSSFLFYMHRGAHRLIWKCAIEIGGSRGLDKEYKQHHVTELLRVEVKNEMFDLG